MKFYLYFVFLLLTLSCKKENSIIKVGMPMNVAEKILREHKAEISHLSIWSPEEGFPDDISVYGLIGNRVVILKLSKTEIILYIDLCKNISKEKLARDWYDVNEVDVSKP